MHRSAHTRPAHYRYAEWLARTTIDLDDELLAPTAKELGTTGKKDTIHAALRAALRKNASRALMDHGLLARCGISDLEAGVSARSPADHHALGQNRRDALEYLTTPDEVWDRAWEVQRALAADGLHTTVKIPDLIIAAVAEHHGMAVIHYDRDFDRIAAVTRQPVEWVVPAGSV